MTGNKGVLMVLSGPSGAGKGTVLGRYLELDNASRYSVSATTRQPRPGEQDGISYFFVSRPEFEEMIKNGGVLEYTTYNGNYYGTPRAAVESWLDEGKNVVLEIEVDGAGQVKKLMPEAVLIFLSPPDFPELERRLRGRGTETEEQIAARLKRAREEMKLMPMYDHTVVNDDPDRAAGSIKAIIDRERERLNGSSPATEETVMPYRCPAE